jgi:hypothetical protein
MGIEPIYYGDNARPAPEPHIPEPGRITVRGELVVEMYGLDTYLRTRAKEQRGDPNELLVRGLR